MPSSSRCTRPSHPSSCLGKPDRESCLRNKAKHTLSPCLPSKELVPSRRSSHQEVRRRSYFLLRICRHIRFCRRAFEISSFPLANFFVQGSGQNSRFISCRYKCRLAGLFGPNSLINRRTLRGHNWRRSFNKITRCSVPVKGGF